MSSASANRVCVFALFIGLGAVGAAPLAAQRPIPIPVKSVLPTPKRKFELPPGFAPPAGMCRIWINNVPPSQQPAPTDCASAVKNRPLNGRVIFGDDKAKGTNRDGVKREDQD